MREVDARMPVPAGPVLKRGTTNWRTALRNGQGVTPAAVNSLLNTDYVIPLPILMQPRSVDSIEVYIAAVPSVSDMIAALYQCDPVTGLPTARLSPSLLYPTLVAGVYDAIAIAPATALPPFVPLALVLAFTAAGAFPQYYGGLGTAERWMGAEYGMVGLYDWIQHIRCTRVYAAFPAVYDGVFASTSTATILSSVRLV